MVETGLSGAKKLKLTSISSVNKTMNVYENGLHYDKFPTNHAKAKWDWSACKNFKGDQTMKK